MKSKHRLTLERYAKYGEGYNPSIGQGFKIRWLWQRANNLTHRAYGKIRSALYIHACVLVGLPGVCMCVSRSALCVHVCQSGLPCVYMCVSQVCLVCTCVLVSLPSVYMCVGQSAFCEHVSWSVCLVCVSQSVLCVCSLPGSVCVVCG